MAKSASLKAKIAGPEISLSKRLWRAHVFGIGFILPFLLSFLDFEDGLANVLLFHVGSAGARVLGESALWRARPAWSDLFGRAHNVFHLLGLVLLFRIFWPTEVTGPNLMLMAYFYCLIVTAVFQSALGLFEENGRFARWLQPFALALCYALYLVLAASAYELGLFNSFMS